MFAEIIEDLRQDYFVALQNEGNRAARLALRRGYLYFWIAFFYHSVTSLVRVAMDLKRVTP